MEVISASIVVDTDDYCPNRTVSSCGCIPKTPGGVTCNTEKCVNYAMLTECVNCNENCQNQHLQRGKHANVEVLEVGEKGFGLFTLEKLIAHQFVAEYVGELISEAELIRRLTSSVDEQHLYMMQLKDNTYVDARYKGAMTRHINHSCDPNCTVQVWSVKGRYRVGIFTIKPIEEGTELTFDYQWMPSNRRPTKCLCGCGPKCRGYIEVMTEQQLRAIKEEEEAVELQEKLVANQRRRGMWLGKEEAVALLEGLATKNMRQAQMIPDSMDVDLATKTDDNNNNNIYSKAIDANAIPAEVAADISGSSGGVV